MDSSRRKRTFLRVSAAMIALLVCCFQPVSTGLPRAVPGERAALEGTAQTDPGSHLTAAAAGGKLSPKEEKKRAAERAGAGSPGREETVNPVKAASRGGGADAGLEKQKFRSQPEPLRKKKSRPKKQAPRGPVSYVWGGAHRVTFRSRVRLTNTGGKIAKNVWVDLPMLENSSPYQQTRLKSTSHEPAYMTGRIGSFGVGDLEPGQAVVIKTDYEITMRPVALKSTNETVEKARQLFRLSSGSGSCGDQAKEFVRRCRDKGIKARLVNGYAGTGGGKIAPGSLKGRRHSWAEFYLDGLGWVPVDLTFNYFASLPHASHVVETYADKSVKIYHLGGKIDVKWDNEILDHV